MLMERLKDHAFSNLEHRLIAKRQPFWPPYSIGGPCIRTPLNLTESHDRKARDPEHFLSTVKRMAELAVVGLVGNIIQLIDFGTKLVSATRDVHGSLNGTTAEVDELTHILSSVQSSNERVKNMQVSPHALSQDETTLLGLVKECEKLAKTMQKVLDKLKKRDSTWKTYEDLRVAFQTLSKRKDLEDLRRRLEALDSKIRMSFSHVLQG